MYLLIFANPHCLKLSSFSNKQWKPLQIKCYAMFLILFYSNAIWKILVELKNVLGFKRKKIKLTNDLLPGGLNLGPLYLNATDLSKCLLGLGQTLI